MYTLGDFIQFMKSRNLIKPDAKLIVDLKGVLGKSYDTNFHDRPITEFQEVVGDGVPFLKIREFTNPDEAGHVLESIMLSRFGYYQGDFIVCKVTNGGVVDGPVLYLNEKEEKLWEHGGYIYRINRSGSVVKSQYSNYTLLEKSHGRWPVQGNPFSILSDTYHLFKNPSTKHMDFPFELFEEDNCYWGELLFYNPIFPRKAMVNVHGVWMVVSMAEIETKASGKLKEELSFLYNFIA